MVGGNAARGRLACRLRRRLLAAAITPAALFTLLPSSAGNGRTRGPARHCHARMLDRSQPAPRTRPGGLTGVSRTRRKSILRESRSTRLTCTRTAIRHAVADARALAAQLVLDLVVLEVIRAEFGDMHQPFDEQRIQLHEDAERRHAVDHAAVFLAELVAHEIALEPGFDVARGFVGTAFIRRTMQPELFPDRDVVALTAARFVVGFLHGARGFRQAACSA